MIKKKILALAILSCLFLAEKNVTANQEAYDDLTQQPSVSSTSALNDKPFHCNEFFDQGFTLSGLGWWILCQIVADPVSVGMLGA
ncbi:MAG: hypothetical protein J0G29_04700 [Alphaproteobacteria bacterium]|nr:hypothetical protein [Alphaproteobacteria bacterium]OJV45133.1 MAG: hypothetical protein BGO28_03875 [Alphaproteobacteria bacterium 43-37]